MKRDRTLVVLAIVLAVVIGFLARGSVSVALQRSSGAEGPAYPPLPDDARPVRIEQLVQTRLTGPYAFMHVDTSGRPVRYDPCRPIHYVVNPAGGPANAVAMARDATASIGRATGLLFIDDGVTDESPSERRAPVQRDRYGDRWAPVLIAFAAPGGLSDLTGNVAGLGGSLPVTTRAGSRLVTGQITLRSDTYQQLVDDGRVGQATTILMHELGHVVGLDHVNDPGQLMYVRNKGQVNYGPGDLAGLALAGAGPCFDDT